MLVKPNGEVRYFTVRESARIQTFPDGYRFHGSWTEAMRQLGNAVPVLLAQQVGQSVAQRLLESQLKDVSSQPTRQRRSAA
jgi:DNA (cytosine-5)-methyltransferase 1